MTASTVSKMDQVTGWMMTKCNEALTTVNDASTIRKEILTRLVTPESIPKFAIPPPWQETCSISRDLGLCSFKSSSHFLPCSNSTIPGNFDRNRLTVFSRNIVKSLPVSPSCPPMRLPGHRFASASYNDIDKFKDTNIDPQSLQAMELQHLRTKTSFGFDTLIEVPHTRRKESLFHDSSVNILNNSKSLLCVSSHYQQCCKTDASSASNLNFLPGISISMDSVQNNNKHNNKQQTVPSMVMSLGVLSPSQCAMDSYNSLMYSSCSSSCTMLEIPTHQGHPLKTGRSISLMSSSIPATDDSSDSTNLQDNSSIDLHHHFQYHSHRHDSSPVTLNLNNINTLMHRRSTIQQRQEHHHKKLKHSKSMDHPTGIQYALLCKNQGNNAGEVKLSVHYMEELRQLRVILLKAINLGHSDQRHTVSPYVKLYLSPGKHQKQCSAVVKQTRSPVFSEEFYFNGVDLEELLQMNLQVKVG